MLIQFFSVALDIPWDVLPGGLFDGGMTGGFHLIFGKQHFLGTKSLEYGTLREKRKGHTV